MNYSSRIAWLVLVSLAVAFSPLQAQAGEPSHPALWEVHGQRGVAYLFGSIHILPPNVEWRAPAIGDAIQRSKVFVFEIPNDATTQTRIAKLVSDQGELPAGASLRAMLSANAQADYDSDLALAHVSPRELDQKRPWLADLFLVMRNMAQENASPVLGVDAMLMREATAGGKEIRYLETLDDQVGLIVPKDPKLELEEFEADLKEFRSEKDEFGGLVSAWSQGDPDAIDRLLNSEFATHPAARRALLDDRNRAWARKLETWLKEPKIFFIAVGAGHLAGKNSLVQMLREHGYRVDGP